MERTDAENLAQLRADVAAIKANLDFIVPHFMQEGTISKLTTMRDEFNLFKNLVRGMWALAAVLGTIWATLHGK